MRLPPQTGQLFIYNPSWMELIDTVNEAVKGQVIKVVKMTSLHSVSIATPAGKDLGVVSEDSLIPFPIRGKEHIIYDPVTGLTPDAEKNLA